MPLRTYYVMPGTELAYAARLLRFAFASTSTRCPVLTYRMLVPGCRGPWADERGAIGLRACYTMPGTDLLYGARHGRRVN
eukprot:227064-Rhodomonas_salina.3